jgi:hypothetical protein
MKVTELQMRREALGLSIQTLSDQAQVTAAFIEMLEDGEYVPAFSAQRERIEQALTEIEQRIVTELKAGKWSPRRQWMVEFEYGTGLGGITRLKALRTALRELRHGRSVTICPPPRPGADEEQWHDLGPGKLRVK